MRAAEYSVRFTMILICGFAAPAAAPAQTVPAGERQTVASLEEALGSGADVWGESAMREPGGPSYAFFDKLLPPLRYVDAAFRHYPIVLSTPGATLKPRLVSNGSAVNAEPGLKTWKSVGTPVVFFVGANRELFGAEPAALNGPEYEKGYLPIVRFRYRRGEVTYTQIAFGPAPPASDDGTICVRVTVTGGPGEVAARIDPSRRHLVGFSRLFEWQASENSLVARLEPGDWAHLWISVNSSHRREGGDPGEAQHSQDVTASFWEKWLAQAAHVEVPEALVNNAWRSLMIGTAMLIKGDELCYSAGNGYERQYECECGDAVRALLLYGHGERARTLLPPLMVYRQQGLAFHDAGFKLQLLAHHYWLTRDRKAVEELRPQWETEVQRIVDGRRTDTGLFPPENYCGDIHEQVHTLTSNSCCWRGLRDMAAVLRDMGETDRAERLANAAAEFRTAIHKASAQSIRRDVDPPFVPVALFGKEKPFENVFESMLGGYWNLVIPYVLDSGVFGPKSQEERWILDRMHRRGGICMGMIRFDQHSGLFANEKGVDDLYGLRYVLALLRHNEVDRALVSFYGKLAHGLTRDTFIGCEGSSLVPLDEHGRPMYLPPNASSNALFLWLLRYMLAADWDRDEDGTPDTLHLAYATPRPWLEDGKTIRIERAPTAFGPVSMAIRSHLSEGRLSVDLDLPPARPSSTRLRLRLPGSHAPQSASTGTQTLTAAPDGSFDLTDLRGRLTLDVNVASK